MVRRSNSVVYPNSPLVEVVFEIRFRPEPTIRCRLDQFFSKLKPQFPIAEPESTIRGPEGVIWAYCFRKADASEYVRLADDRFAYATTTYSNFNAFKETAIPLCREFGEVFGIRGLTGTGLRYVNLIPFTRDRGAIPLDKYLNVDLNIPKGSKAPLEVLDFISIQGGKKGKLTIRIGTLVHKTERAHALVLDLDFGRRGNLDLADIDRYLTESHDVTRRTFQTIITQEYMSFLKGESAKGEPCR